MSADRRLSATPPSARPRGIDRARTRNAPRDANPPHLTRGAQLPWVGDREKRRKQNVSRSSMIDAFGGFSGQAALLLEMMDLFVDGFSLRQQSNSLNSILPLRNNLRFQTATELIQQL